MASTDWRIGTLFAGFELDEVIMRSPIVTTYRGHQAGLTAAIKITRPRWPQRGEREQASHYRTDHPCVARVLAAGRMPCGARFVASEWISGLTLEQRLVRSIEWEELLPILQAVTNGLVAIHAAGLVHRDLKPSNIILPADGRAAAVIQDLGHAALLGAERLTDRSRVVDTAAYMSPEQAAGELVDQRTDLYALGVITYQALAGVLPFDSDSAAALLLRHQVERIVAPRRRAPDRRIPADPEDLCLRLLAKRLENRIPTAAVLSALLAALQAAHQPSAPIATARVRCESPGAASRGERGGTGGVAGDRHR